tara:strand:- start:83 stop:451 length:369 start_codon:yes stop_codon:yes gene_type:complete
MTVCEVREPVKGSLISFDKQIENCGFRHCRFGSNKKNGIFLYLTATIRATISCTIVAWETPTPTPEPLTGSGNIFSFRALICSGVAFFVYVNLFVSVAPPLSRGALRSLYYPFIFIERICYA